MGLCPTVRDGVGWPRLRQGWPETVACSARVAILPAGTGLPSEDPRNPCLGRECACSAGPRPRATIWRARCAGRAAAPDGMRPSPPSARRRPSASRTEPPPRPGSRRRGWFSRRQHHAGPAGPAALSLPPPLPHPAAGRASAGGDVPVLSLPRFAGGRGAGPRTFALLAASALILSMAAPAVEAKGPVASTPHPANTTLKLTLRGTTRIAAGATAPVGSDSYGAATELSPAGATLEQSPRSSSRASSALSSAPNPATVPVVSSSTGFSGFNGLSHLDSRSASGGNQFSLEPPDQGPRRQRPGCRDDQRRHSRV